jgi:predicted HTH transcriptional regulator
MGFNFWVEDKTHTIKGTTFKVKSATRKEELENWLIQRLDPRIDFKTYEFFYSENIRISMFVIPASVNPSSSLIKLTLGLVVIRDYLKNFQIKKQKFGIENRYIRIAIS